MTQSCPPQPQVSVIVPVYNQERYLEECISSIRRQTLAEWECLIINDGSSDSSGEIARRFSEADSRIRYFEQKNRGVSSARNLGMRRASGRYLCFVDGDDFIDAAFLKHLLDASDRGASDLTVAGKLFCDRFPPDKIPALPTCGIFLRREFPLKNNLEFPEGIHPCEDGLFSHFVLALTEKISFCPEAVYHYRQHEQGNHHQIRKRTADILPMIPRWLSLIEEFYEQRHLWKRKAGHLVRFIEHEPFELRLLGMPFSPPEQEILYSIIRDFLTAHCTAADTLIFNFPLQPSPPVAANGAQPFRRPLQHHSFHVAAPASFPGQRQAHGKAPGRGRAHGKRRRYALQAFRLSAETDAPPDPPVIPALRLRQRPAPYAEEPGVLEAWNALLRTLAGKLNLPFIDFCGDMLQYRPLPGSGEEDFPEAYRNLGKQILHRLPFGQTWVRRRSGKIHRLLEKRRKRRKERMLARWRTLAAPPHYREETDWITAIHSEKGQARILLIGDSVMRHLWRPLASELQEDIDLFSSTLIPGDPDYLPTLAGYFPSAGYEAVIVSFGSHVTNKVSAISVDDFRKNYMAFVSQLSKRCRFLILATSTSIMDGPDGTLNEEKEKTLAAFNAIVREAASSLPGAVLSDHHGFMQGRRYIDPFHFSPPDRAYQAGKTAGLLLPLLSARQEPPKEQECPKTRPEP